MSVYQWQALISSTDAWLDVTSGKYWRGHINTLNSCLCDVPQIIHAQSAGSEILCHGHIFSRSPYINLKQMLIWNDLTSLDFFTSRFKNSMFILPFKHKSHLQQKKAVAYKTFWDSWCLRLLFFDVGRSDWKCLFCCLLQWSNVSHTQRSLPVPRVKTFFMAKWWCRFKVLML